MYFKHLAGRPMGGECHEAPFSGIGTRRFAALLVLLALAGCATGPASDIRYVEVEPESLWFICDGRDWEEGSTTNGCYKRDGAVCVIYTMKREEWIKRGRECKYRAVIRHEERHCREGRWHSVPTSSPCEPGD